MRKPQGKLTYIKTDIKLTEHAVYYNPLFKDEAGTLWQGRGSQFLFDLKEVTNESNRGN